MLYIFPSLLVLLECILLLLTLWESVNNINDPQKKHHLGTVSKNILLEGLNRFKGATSPLVPMRIKTHRCLVCMIGPNLSMHHLLEHINQDIKRR